MKELEKNEVIELSKKIWESEKMQKYFQEKYLFYQLKNGGIVEFKKKIPINNTIYYDDETESPNITENYFINHNLRMEFNCNYHEIKLKYECIKPYFIYNYSDNNDILTPCYSEYPADYETDLQWAKQKNLFARFLTDEEIKEYNTIVEYIKQKYIERLKKYYKKYNDQITTSGYWVNR